MHPYALGKTVCSSCERGKHSMQAVDLHYASLHLTNKPHPPQKKETTPPPGDIVYAAVSLKPPANKN
ncbi:hypothetical protein AGOR_G00043780 [Albula goreensis]|uniref:Uncharacterized protein n=1 Tax=Albula goreensis TaxID=1534307 RepID=A0A8T3DZG3_9TELE|nr:hypothetical protein AGOR_G00043780 [Albula goreensis]